MTLEEWAQKFQTDDVPLPRSAYCFWLVVPRGKFASTIQKLYLDLGIEASSVWNFCARYSHVILRKTSCDVAKCWLCLRLNPNKSLIVKQKTGSEENWYYFNPSMLLIGLRKLRSVWMSATLKRQQMNTKVTSKSNNKLRCFVWFFLAYKALENKIQSIQHLTPFYTP